MPPSRYHIIAVADPYSSERAMPACTLEYISYWHKRNRYRPIDQSASMWVSTMLRYPTVRTPHNNDSAARPNPAVRAITRYISADLSIQDSAPPLIHPIYTNTKPPYSNSEKEPPSLNITPDPNREQPTQAFKVKKLNQPTSHTAHTPAFPSHPHRHHHHRTPTPTQTQTPTTSHLHHHLLQQP